MIPQPRAEVTVTIYPDQVIAALSRMTLGNDGFNSDNWAVRDAETLIEAGCMILREIRQDRAKRDNSGVAISESTEVYLRQLIRTVKVGTRGTISYPGEARPFNLDDLVATHDSKSQAR